MSEHLPASVDIASLVQSLAGCDYNHFDIAEIIGLPVDQMRRDYANQLKAREVLIDDAYYCAQALVKRLRRHLEAGTHEQMPRHVFNESAKLVVETLKSKGGWTVNPVTATLNYDMSNPEVVKALKVLGVELG